MTQHDYVLDSASGAAFRSDLNNLAQAILTTNKGNSAPATTAAGMKFIDGDTPSSSKWSEYIHDGTDAIKHREIDTTNNVIVQQVGGGAVQDIASSGTTDLGSVWEATINVTGTTTITAFGSSALKGHFKFVKFAGALTLTHNGTSLILPTAADIVTAAGDSLIAEHMGSGNWKVHHYTRANGTPVGGATYKVGNFTRDISTASGTQAVTGVGFKPKAVIFIAAVAGTTWASWGMDDASTDLSINANNGAVADNFGSSTVSIRIVDGEGDTYTGSVQSFDSDGFTIDWTKTGTISGTLSINYIAFR